ncbi:hypothetical protein [Tsukamurella spumae]|uniref:Uncharacterized protein n=1 Tax=Tsukamurella spumae TaxID=44753 RepID=A0A846X6W1_9ACTN|nr:hypothetical protein [Tsukamurella spumae]NKY19510.1 hypothetical protein [Tsukamurella spumae]
MAGRVSKGDRAALFSRCDPRIAAAAKRGADDHGLTVSDYLAWLVARDNGLDEIAPAAQEVLLPTAS